MIFVQGIMIEDHKVAQAVLEVDQEVVDLVARCAVIVAIMGTLAMMQVLLHVNGTLVVVTVVENVVLTVVEIVEVLGRTAELVVVDRAVVDHLVPIAANPSRMNHSSRDRHQVIHYYLLICWIFESVNNNNFFFVVKICK